MHLYIFSLSYIDKDALFKQIEFFYFTSLRLKQMKKNI